MAEDIYPVDIKVLISFHLHTKTIFFVFRFKKLCFEPSQV